MFWSLTISGNYPFSDDGRIDSELIETTLPLEMCCLRLKHTFKTITTPTFVHFSIDFIIRTNFLELVVFSNFSWTIMWVWWRGWCTV